MVMRLIGALLIATSLTAIRFTARRTAVQPMSALAADLASVGLTTLLLFGGAFIAAPSL